MKSTVRLIKKEKLQAAEIQPEEKPAEDPKKWSKVVRSWINEAQQQTRDESLPAFDSLFKEPASGGC